MCNKIFLFILYRLALRRGIGDDRKELKYHRYKTTVVKKLNIAPNANSWWTPVKRPTPIKHQPLISLRVAVQ